MGPWMMFAGVLLVMLVPATAASQNLQAPAPKTPPVAPSPKPKDPYSELYQRRSLVQEALAQLRAASGAKAAPSIRCGMRVIPADAAIDPKIHAGPPSTPAIEHTLRIIEPPVCGAADATKK